MVGRTMFTKQFERRVYVAVIIFLGSAAFGGAFGTYILWPSHREAGYMPKQPIAFSHELHAGTLQIDCQYCHTEADSGPHATVPPLSTCMNCHEEVRPKDAQGDLKPGIVSLLEHWEAEEPIRWNKVHDLADFSFFDHSRHVNSGISCQECHGPVERMEHMQREYGMKMSWCLSCHREPPEENSTAAELGWDTQGPIHCTACHR